MNEIGPKPAHTVTELASARQHQEKPGRPSWIMERAVEGIGSFLCARTYALRGGADLRYTPERRSFLSPHVSP